jgi:uncharacterized protein (TIGR02996 family)
MIADAAPVRECIDMSDLLLAALREEPDDGLARMAYADWLDDNGDPDRARFIRLQLAADRQPPRSSEAAALSAQAEEVLAGCERDWLGEGWAEVLVDWSFRSGLLDSVTLEPEVFLARGEELFAAHPVLREVRFVGEDGDAASGDSAEELAAAPAFARVRTLNAAGATPSAGPQWCRALARATHLSRLQELNLGNAWRPAATFVDFDSLQALCEAEHLRTLRKLDLSAPLSFVGPGDEAVALLLAAPFFPHLTELSLGGCQISDDGVRALLSGGRRLALEDLTLSWCERLTRAATKAVCETQNLPRLTGLSLGGDFDLAALARSPLLARLERLDLCTSATRYGREFVAADWAALAASSHAGSVRRLALLHSLMDEAGCDALFCAPGPLRLHSLMLMGGTPEMAPLLAASPALRTLTAVELISCRFDSAAVKALLAAPFVPNLTQFCLAGNEIGSRGLYALLSSGLRAGRLDDLHLHHCGLAPGALKKLAAWPGLANLERLELGANEVTAEVMEALLASKHFGRRLTSLQLASGAIADAALEALGRSRALPRLRDVTVVGAQVAPEAVAALRQRFGARLKIDPRG